MVYNFPEGISLKVNAIARLQFELAYKDVIVQHFSHYNTETLSGDTSLTHTLYICVCVCVCVCVCSKKRKKTFFLTRLVYFVSFPFISLMTCQLFT